MRIEQGKLDPGARRLNLLVRLYDLSPEDIADLVSVEARRIDIPEGQSLARLLKDYDAAWNNGELYEALAYLLAMDDCETISIEEVHLKLRARLLFGVRAYDLGHPKLALRIVSKVLCAEDLSDELKIGALQLAGTLWQTQGAHDVGLALVKEAISRIKPEDSANLATSTQTLVVTKLRAGDLVGAESMAQTMLDRMQQLGDSRRLVSAYLLAVRLYVLLGNRAEAVKHSESAERLLSETKREITKVSVFNQIGWMWIEFGEPTKAIQPCHSALATATRIDDFGGMFDAHYRLWRAYRDLGEEGTADLELEQAHRLIPKIDAGEEGVKEVMDAYEKVHRRKRKSG